MSSITEGNLKFVFPDDWRVSKLDAWNFYRNQFQSIGGGGTKAMDILAMDPRGWLWLIEVKDYRRHNRTNTADLAIEIAEKVKDSLALLFAARVNANDADEQELARRTCRCDKIRIILHLELPVHPSRLFQPAINAANVLQRLRQVVRAIDPHPKVTSLSRPGDVRWQVESGSVFE